MSVIFGNCVNNIELSYITFFITVCFFTERFAKNECHTNSTVYYAEKSEIFYKYLLLKAYGLLMHRMLFEIQYVHKQKRNSLIMCVLKII